MEFTFPDVGEGIGEGKLVGWKVSEGDTVEDDQVLCEVETDKAVVEIPSPTAGTIQKLHQQEGDVVKVGEPLVTFGDAEPAAEHKEASAPVKPKDEDHWRAPERGTAKIESSLAPKAPKPHEVEPAHAPPTRNAAAKHEPTPHEGVDHAQGPVTQQPARVLATPSTRRLARERDVDIQSVHGTGPSGRVTKEDVEKAAGGRSDAASDTPTQPVPEQTEPEAEQPPQPEQPTERAPAPEPTQAGQTIPYTGIRKAIGDHMDAANQVPDVTEFAKADVTDLVELRSHLKQKAEDEGVKLTYLALFAKAACAAIAKHPVLNAHFSPDGITTFADVDLGIAVDTERGLMVPVIREANHKSVLGLAKEIDTVASAARDGTLGTDRMQGSTFSITSIGPLRVEGFTPRLNTPEVAILGIGAIREEPAVVDGHVTPRKLLTLSLTFDHRALDGAEAARFLTDLVELLEDPELLVLEGI